MCGWGDRWGLGKPAAVRGPAWKPGWQSLLARGSQGPGGPAEVSFAFTESTQVPRERRGLGPWPFLEKKSGRSKNAATVSHCSTL